MTRVEERLTELLHSSAPRSQGVAFDDVKRRVRRRRTVHRSLAASAATAAVVAATVLATTLIGQPQRESATPSVNLAGTIPWIDAPITPYEPPAGPPPSPPATDARPCTARDVTATLADSNGAGGHRVDYVRFRNASTSTCVLKGYPRVVAVEPGRAPVTATNGSFFPNESTANMRPGQDTYLGVETDSFCDAHPGGGPSGPVYHRLDVTLPGGGTVVVNAARDGFAVVCGLHLTQFFVQPAEQASGPDPLGDLTVALEVPPTVAAGSTLVYVADLSNPTGTAVSLDRCPSYVETGNAGPTPLKEAYALNCGPAGPIAAHETVRFEMRLRVPLQTPRGPLTVRWSTATPFPVTAEATVTVTTEPLASGAAIVTGVVRMTGGPVGAGKPGISGTVWFDDVTTGQRYRATAAADGTFSAAVPPGTYTVTATSRQYGGRGGLCTASAHVVVTETGLSGVVVSCHLR